MQSHEDICMFVGHFGVGLLAKQAAPRLSLGTLFLAAQWADLLWPVLLLLGIETVQVNPGETYLTPLHFSHYPVSHSLLSLLLWGLCMGLLWFAGTRIRTSLWLLPLLVLSHFGLDALVHRADLPLLPWGGPHIGLGLWNSVPATLLAEGGLLLLGIVSYLRTTKAKNRIGQIGFWVFVFCLLAIETANFLSPPPSKVTVLAWAANFQWLLVAAGYFIDRHRTSARAQTNHP